jgi:hypothetical protein
MCYRLRSPRWRNRRYQIKNIRIRRSLSLLKTNQSQKRERERWSHWFLSFTWRKNCWNWSRQSWKRCWMERRSRITRFLNCHHLKSQRHHCWRTYHFFLIKRTHQRPCLSCFPLKHCQKNPLQKKRYQLHHESPCLSRLFWRYLSRFIFHLKNHRSLWLNLR